MRSMGGEGVKCLVFHYTLDYVEHLINCGYTSEDALGSVSERLGEVEGFLFVPVLGARVKGLVGFVLGS